MKGRRGGSGRGGGAKVAAERVTLRPSAEKLRLEQGGDLGREPAEREAGVMGVNDAEKSPAPRAPWRSPRTGMGVGARPSLPGAER